MTRDDIIRMAREAGAATGRHSPYQKNESIMPLCMDVERFAALVTAAEREKVAEWMIEHGYATGHGDTVEDLLKELEWQIREREREECAKIADKRNREKNSVADRIARKIRARDEQKEIKWEIEP